MNNVHRVPTGTVAAMQSQPTSTETTMQQALTEAGITETSRTSYFASEHVARQVAWGISNLIGQVCTRIQRLAQGKGNTPDEATPGEVVKGEIRTMMGKLIWGYDNLGQFMKPLEQAAAEWAGGGYSRPARDEELAKAAEFLGMTLEQMREADATRRQNMTDYLTIRRQGLAPVMEAKIASMLSMNFDAIEPADEVIEDACNKAFSNRILWGDWAGAALVKDDMAYHLGKTPTMPTSEEQAAQAAKASRIREELANQQAAQAAKDAETLRDFDPLSIAA